MGYSDADSDSSKPVVVCPRCAAMVNDLETHSSWHREIEGTDQPTPPDGPARYWILDERE